MWNKTILMPVMEWDYGKQERGDSLEKVCFFQTLRKHAKKVVPFWIDAYLKDKASLQKDLLEQADRTKPDLIFFIPFRDEFSFELLDRLKSRYATFAWFGDDHWRFDSFSSRYAPYYSYVATTDIWGVDRYRKIGIEPIVTQWAAQSFTEPAIPREDEAYEYDISFIGGVNPYRKWFIRQLLGKGIKVECFGAGWPRGRVTYEQMERIFATSRVNLNLSNSVCHDLRFITASPGNLLAYVRSAKRNDQIKARNFEIPLAGGFQLSHYVPGLEQYLQIGKEVAVFTGIDDCTVQIEYYLKHPEMRRAVIEASHHRSVREHTYFHRLQAILDKIWGPRT